MITLTRDEEMCVRDCKQKQNAWYENLNDLKEIITVYTRRGQTDARGLHVARQRFFAAPVTKF
jgi:hypothetical protein